ncbi:hypothetical protein ACHHYP_07088 [Achlya hypogyna]|uniref:Uncharacterized protein n=1 Tax=Achlya hypogyna TaxID=1202772 RepID=A0A1V9ZMU3_ACHHY|nr:hypothetical protein ACHHYP_07088 [Achlya hypogyna]
MKPGSGLLPTASVLGVRLQTSNQLKTPLVVKQPGASDPAQSPFDHVADYSTANTQFHTADLSDPFQHVPEATNAFAQAAPVGAPAPVASNFNSADSASDELANMFGGPPPVAKQRDVEPPRPASISDPFSATLAPPPPAAPFLGYNQSPYASANTSPMFAPPMQSPSPSFAHRQQSPLSIPPSPQRQPSQILPPPRTVAELFEAFMAQIAPDMQPRPTHAADEPSFNGLHALYDQQRWKSLEAAADRLSGASEDPSLVLLAHSWRLVALFKQRNVVGFEKVLGSLGDLDGAAYRWETYPQYGKTGSFVPHRLHFLATQLPRLKSNYAEYEAASAAFETRTGDDMAWRDMATAAMVNSFVERKKLHLALRLSVQHLAANDARWSPWHRLLWTSRIGRLHLQMGNLVAAERAFAKAEALHGAVGHDCSPRLLLNQGLLFFGQNKFKEALDTFNTILELHTAPEPRYVETDPFLSVEDGDVVSCAANNLAICALYSCEVLTAVNVLESVVQSDPVRHLHAAIVFNLSTLYDLVCDNANATNRKEMIKRVAEAYTIEHIESASFRI